MANGLFGTYKNSIITHEKYMFQTESDILMARMCAYPSSNYALPHWKYFLRFCAQFPHIDIPSPESDQRHSNVILTIRFFLLTQGTLYCALTTPFHQK